MKILSFSFSLSLSLFFSLFLSLSLCLYFFVYLREECKVILYMWRFSSISSIVRNETKRCSIKVGTRRSVTFFIENRSGNVRINFIRYHNVFSRELIFTVSFISTLFKLAASSWFNAPDEEAKDRSDLARVSGSWILSIARFLLCYHFSTCCTVESDHAIQRWRSPIVSYIDANTYKSFIGDRWRILFEHSNLLLLYIKKLWSYASLSSFVFADKTVSCELRQNWMTRFRSFHHRQIAVTGSKGFVFLFRSIVDLLGEETWMKANSLRISLSSGNI